MRANLARSEILCGSGMVWSTKGLVTGGPSFPVHPEPTAD
jgi:hypothetical protein